MQSQCIVDFPALCRVAECVENFQDVLREQYDEPSRSSGKRLAIEARILPIVALGKGDSVHLVVIVKLYIVLYCISIVYYINI